MFVVHIEIDLVVMWHATKIIEVGEVGIREHGQFLVKIEFITVDDLVLVRLDRIEIVDELGKVGPSAPGISRHDLAFEADSGISTCDSNGPEPGLYGISQSMLTVLCVDFMVPFTQSLSMCDHNDTYTKKWPLLGQPLGHRYEEQR